MTKKNKYEKISPQTQEEALKMAKATQRPGQSKEQTKLIAQGIEKGINLYKKQQKVRSRELSKKLHKASLSLASSESSDEQVIQQGVVLKESFLPWLLLLISWVIFLVFFFLQ